MFPKNYTMTLKYINIILFYIFVIFYYFLLFVIKLKFESFKTIIVNLFLKQKLKI